MDKEKLINKVCNELVHGKNIDFTFEINGIPYSIKFLSPNNDLHISIPSIIAVPLTQKFNNQLIVEANNMESDNLDVVLQQGIQTGIRLAHITDNLPCTIVVPLIPSYRDKPYFQQLSKECFELDKEDRNYRIDEQIVRIIQQAKMFSEETKGLPYQSKIFLNGYSSSGVFAQRFSLLHPELIDTACIGGASGSIPVPSPEIGYPIGIEDYEEITGRKFDMDSYSSIKFRYYVGELETKNTIDTRLTDDGSPAPMHDMSYFNRSVPVEIGKKQRTIFGQEMFERASKTIQLLNLLGIDIEHTIFEGRTHNNRSGHGVNELGDKFIIEVYRESVINKEKDYLTR